MQASLMELIKILSSSMYFIVGMISFIMAYKCIFSKKYVPFHEKAAGKAWNDIDSKLREVILALLRLSGLGFLVTGLLLVIIPVVDYFIPNNKYTLIAAGIALIYCAGLCIINYILHKKANTRTPWKGALYATLIIALAMCMSALLF